MMNQGSILALTGKVADAVQMITSGIAAFRPTGSTLWIPFYLSYLARAHAKLDQFEEAYGQKNTIWGNTEAKIFHAPNNERTAERLSRYILGPATVDNPVMSRQGLLGRGSVSYQVVERPLLTTDEVQALSPAQMIVRRTGSKPMLLDKLGYDYLKREEAA